MNEVLIISAKRTPVGGFLGSLSHLTATQLGSIAIRAAYNEAGVEPGHIDSVYMGNVLQAGLGQSPARQAAMHAGVPDHVDSTTVNKVCASGIKSVMLGAQQIQSGFEHLVIAGGMESMSNVPHYASLRGTHKLGHEQMPDGLLKDGLTDAYNGMHMGNSAELCAKTYGLSREEQDAYALESYARAQRAQQLGKFNRELVSVEGNRKQLIIEDEDPGKLIPEKVPTLKPVFESGGTITAANASNLNDGAATLLLASAEAAERYGLKPVARILSFADAAQAPEWFTTAPSLALPKAARRAGLSLQDIDYIEINEAYAAVALANIRLMKLDPRKVNVYGGAVAIGHPLGASGARILCTLLSVLQQENGRYGAAVICNGGGGASAIIIENISQS